MTYQAAEVIGGRNFDDCNRRTAENGTLLI